MRDSRRIWPLLKAIEREWVTQPDTRLCQLLCNLLGHHRDLFHVEDEEILAALAKEKK